MDIEKIQQVLWKYYGFPFAKIQSVQGGWAAAAFVVSTPTKRYFLKVYDMMRASSHTYTKYIRGYTQVLLSLPQLRPYVPMPILTQAGETYVQTPEYTYLLMEYIPGETIGDRPFLETHGKQVIQIVNLLHMAKTDEVEGLPVEDFWIEMVEKLMDYLESPVDDQVNQIISPFLPKLQKAIKEVAETARQYKTQPVERVLCHTDIHPWNLMCQGSHVWLVDFEGLKLSPKENDLALFPQSWHDLLREEYQKLPLDEKLLQYYSQKRVLEDIWEWIELLVVDKSTDKRAEYLDSLSEELKNL